MSAATGQPKYNEKVCKIRNILDGLHKPYGGLYLNFLSPTSGNWSSDFVSVGAFGDSFYEYLIKSWVQSNGTDTQSRRMFDTTAEAIRKHLVKKSSKGLGQ